jgi:hypothetical protein|tara:strand:+ start:469 stop:705 length:237 start_codon:yes stop_codon:yes gene_type:complete
MADKKAFDKELDELKKLAGVGSYSGLTPYSSIVGENIGSLANDLSKVAKKKKIQPGTQAWFRLWFSKPWLTGEKPYDD